MKPEYFDGEFTPFGLIIGILIGLIMENLLFGFMIGLLIGVAFDWLHNIIVSYRWQRDHPDDPDDKGGDQGNE